MHTPSWLHAVGLGVFLMLYGGYVLLLRSPWRLMRNSLTGQVISGALGGITGATAALPRSVRHHLVRVPWLGERQQRAIYQPYILVMQVAVLAVLTAVRPTTTLRPELLAYSLPALLGAWVGLRLYGQVNWAHFNKVVSVTLLLAGIALTLKGL